MIGESELYELKGDDDELTNATSLANLLASQVAVLVSLEVVDDLMMNVKAVRASTVLNALTLVIRLDATPKYVAS